MRKMPLNMVLILNMLVINSACAGEMGNANASTEWTGSYIGINAGYIFPNNKAFNVDPYVISDAGGGCCTSGHHIGH